MCSCWWRGSDNSVDRWGIGSQLDLHEGKTSIDRSIGRGEAMCQMDAREEFPSRVCATIAGVKDVPVLTEVGAKNCWCVDTAVAFATRCTPPHRAEQRKEREKRDLTDNWRKSQRSKEKRTQSSRRQRDTWSERCTLTILDGWEAIDDDQFDSKLVRTWNSAGWCGVAARTVAKGIWWIIWPLGKTRPTHRDKKNNVDHRNRVSGRSRKSLHFLDRLSMGMRLNLNHLCTGWHHLNGSTHSDGRWGRGAKRMVDSAGKRLGDWEWNSSWRIFGMNEDRLCWNQRRRRMLSKWRNFNMHRR